jgi:hypothetical protein
MTKFKEGMYVVLTVELTSCGCSEVTVGTIGRIQQDGPDEDSDVKIQFCKGGCTNYVNISKLKVDEYNQRELETKFQLADDFNYANIN